MADAKVIDGKAVAAGLRRRVADVAARLRREMRLTAGLAAICRMQFFGASRESLAEIYPTAEQARITVAIIHAARLVRDLNFKYLRKGKGAVVTARFGKDGITIVDPNRGRKGGVLKNIYEKAL